MKKLKSALILLCLAALLVLGALSPALVSRAQDVAVTGSVAYETVPPIHLDFQQLSVLDKLQMLESRTLLDLNAAQAGKTGEEIRALADAAIAPYLELLGIDSLSEHAFTASPTLCYRYSPAGSVSYVVWTVCYFRSFDGEDAFREQVFTMHLDEETGTPLLLDFSDSGGLFPEDRLPDALQSTAAVYLNGLGQDAQSPQFLEPAELELAEKNYSRLDDSSLCCVCWVGDTGMGEIELCFYAGHKFFCVLFY